MEEPENDHEQEDDGFVLMVLNPEILRSCNDQDEKQLDKKTINSLFDAGILVDDPKNLPSGTIALEVPNGKNEYMSESGDDDRVDFVARESFLSLGSYFCLFCPETFRPDHVRAFECHLHEHMRIARFCYTCDSVSNKDRIHCSAFHPEPSPLEVELSQVWTRNMIQSQSFLLNSWPGSWFNVERKDRILYAGCPVCERLISLCQIPDVLRGSSTFASSEEFSRHCRKHLSLLTHICLRCWEYQSFGRLRIRNHVLIHHREEPVIGVNIAENRIRKMEEFIAFLAFQRDLKIRTTKDRHDISLKLFQNGMESLKNCTKMESNGLSGRKPCYIRCLQCRHEFYSNRSYRQHHQEVHPTLPKLIWTPTISFYVNFFQIV